MTLWTIYNSLHDFVEREEISLPRACQYTAGLAERYSYGDLGFLEVLTPWGEKAGEFQIGDTAETFLARCIANINDR